MARVFVNQAWYEQVEPSTFSESEFETRVAFHAPSIYSHYLVSRFKRKLAYPDESEEGSSNVVPDLLFVSKDYDEWWLVELEMIYHQLKGHVLPQIQKLQKTVFEEADIDYVCKEDVRVDKSRFRELVLRKRPGILVIANAHSNDWKSEVGKQRATLASFELFRSATGTELFRVDGEYPSILVKRICDCSLHPLLPNLLSIKDPSPLPSERSLVVKLIYNGCMTEWRRIEEQDEVFLMAANRSPLLPRQKYGLYLQNDGQLVLRFEKQPYLGIQS